MNNETNKPAEAQELTDKELEGVAGGKAVLPVLPILQPYRPFK